MHNLKVNHLIQILEEAAVELEEAFIFQVNPEFLKGKGEILLSEAFAALGGEGQPILLDSLKFDFKINRFLFLYDDEVHFNRYRLSTLKTGIYDVFSFYWADAYKRQCRTFERECLKVGLQERIWNGPPIAAKVFGKGEEFGDLSGNGSPGWKLNAYNDAQYDLMSRLHGYKLIRISVYENIMTGGSLKQIDGLLLNPKEENHKAISNWLLRKME
ncbi:hypothetical protein P872_04610 [Rhodonellum psychrophilum GCM71 = DSM 17998]|uniref:Uncharacterized protein n=2 Tax=Rhodonellum TaxID=336827 RepID=U5BYD9_9BACT|nr:MULTISPECIES: hypothetical protein [Rhodonellum]ERM82599.1 hypothetical protein P872_04610 [Rhodonellum psychrophilum GCM71 = DSM 17998]MDO9553906.1 hypothetical protein [Rhodonellum sp.]SDZ53442.1 hypothetical protein SAMN05444412_12134 [Rhodonellum ikkaensis]